jgi:hypothetical protein
MENKYVLMVCPILKDGKDFGGNPYRGVGEFIQAKVFVKDGNTDTGLYGILWGKCQAPLPKNMMKFNWAIVKTEINENLLTLDRRKNEVKFKRGIILYMGKIKSCADYILRIKDDEQQFFAEEAKHLKAEDIIGSNEWSQKQRENRW